MSMTAISLWQPWASAMADDLKRVETRGWATGFRGDLVICSAKRKPSREEVGDDETYEKALTLPYGSALCVVQMYGCITTESVVFRLGIILFEREREWGDYTPGRFGWLTRNCRKLKTPVPVIGRQGFFYLPPDVEAAVRAQL